MLICRVLKINLLIAAYVVLGVELLKLDSQNISWLALSWIIGGLLIFATYMDLCVAHFVHLQLKNKLENTCTKNFHPFIGWQTRAGISKTRKGKARLVQTALHPDTMAPV